MLAPETAVYCKQRQPLTFLTFSHCSSNFRLSGSGGVQGHNFMNPSDPQQTCNDKQVGWTLLHDIGKVRR